jgi:hypothetical protein
MQTFFFNVTQLQKFFFTTYTSNGKKYVCIPRGFLVINVCNQGKTLCSPCIIRLSQTTIYTCINHRIIFEVPSKTYLWQWEQKKEVASVHHNCQLLDKNSRNISRDVWNFSRYFKNCTIFFSRVFEDPPPQIYSAGPWPWNTGLEASVMCDRPGNMTENENFVPKLSGISQRAENCKLFDWRAQA